MSSSKKKSNSKNHNPVHQKTFSGLSSGRGSANRPRRTEVKRPQGNAVSKVDSGIGSVSMSKSVPDLKRDSELKSRPESVLDVQHKPEAKAEVETKAVPETEVKSESALQAESKPEIKAESEPESEPEVVAETAVESELEVDIEPELEAETEPEPKSEPESEPELEPESEPELEPESEPELEPELELKSESELEPESLMEAESDQVSQIEPESESGPEPEQELEPEDVSGGEDDSNGGADNDSCDCGGSALKGQSPDVGASDSACKAVVAEKAAEHVKENDVETDVKDVERSHGRGGMRFFRRMTWIMVIFSAIVVALFVLSTYTAMVAKAKSKVQESGKSENVINVSIKEMHPETFRQLLLSNADLKNLNGAVSMTAPVSGVVVSNTVRLGERVSAGDELGVMDASDIGVDYNMAPVISKAAGTVVAVNAIENQKVAAGTVLYVIEPDPEFVLSASVSESDVDSIRLYSKATFVTAGDRSKTHEAWITYISPVVNTATRTIPIELTVDKTADNLVGLRNGNFVELTLVKSERDNVFVLPKDAIRTYDGKSVVYLAGSDNIAKRVEVTLGLSTQSQIIVSSGLSEGDRVIVQGNPQDGDKIQVL